MNMYIVAFLIGRIMVGSYFISAGMNHFRNLAMLAGYAKTKGTPAAELSVGVTGAMLVAGGASLLLGFHPTAGSGLLIIFLLGASFKIHNFWAVTDPAAKMMDMVNFTKNMGLIGLLLMLVYAPKPWPISLGALGF